MDPSAFILYLMQRGMIPSASGANQQYNPNVPNPTAQLGYHYDPSAPDTTGMGYRYDPNVPNPTATAPTVLPYYMRGRQ